MSILPLSDAFLRRRVESFLSGEGLRLELEGEYIALMDEQSGEIVAGGGLDRDVIKCVAVRSDIRSSGLMGRVITELIARATRSGFSSVKAFTKPENRVLFESLGFKLLASAPEAVLLENGSGLERYKAYLSSEVARTCDTAAGPLPGGSCGAPREEITPSGNARSYCTAAGPLPGGSCGAPRREITPSGNARTCRTASGQDGPVGVIVLNANPFTKGHRYLIETAADRVGRLFVIPVREERSEFCYADRKAMIEAGCRDLDNVTVLEGSAYAISAVTFPTYFLKDLSKASETQMHLDIDLFCRHIAPAIAAGPLPGGSCGAPRRENTPSGNARSDCTASGQRGMAPRVIRYAGSEPGDALTAEYNHLMARMLPDYGIGYEEIERLYDGQGRVYSASAVRSAMAEGRFADALNMVPHSSAPWILAKAAGAALRTELGLEPKPGLVSPLSRGAHDDMDAAVMERSISAIEPYFARMAEAGMEFGQDIPKLVEQLRRQGMEAEKAMLQASGGVNTHKGAIFCMGISIAAVAHAFMTPKERKMQAIGYQELGQINPCDFEGVTFDNQLLINQIHFTVKMLAEKMQQAEGTHGGYAVRMHGYKGALRMAKEGYKPLFDSWLPFLQAHRDDPFKLHKTLLLIMSQLEDTCILYRVGPTRADLVREESAGVLQDFSLDALQAMDVQYSAEGISPGGAADMLALTILLDSLSSSPAAGPEDAIKRETPGATGPEEAKTATNIIAKDKTTI